MLRSSSVTSACPALLLLQQRQQQLWRLWCTFHKAAMLHLI
jgi:hypothetical protein